MPNKSVLSTKEPPCIKEGHAPSVEGSSLNTSLPLVESRALQTCGT